MNVELTNKIRLTDSPPKFCHELMEVLTFSNPAFEEAKKRGRWTGKIPRTLSSYSLEPDGALIVPRGFIGQLQHLAGSRGEEIILTDRRRTRPEVSFTFRGELRGYQREAVADVLSQDFGILNAPTGSGKTTMGLAVIAERKQPTLIIVHTKELLHQWIDRASQFLGMDPEEIGQIGNGARGIGDRLTVGIVNSIYPFASAIRERIGFLIVDECHHCPSRTFTEAVSAFDSKFMLGLSATPYRRDELGRIMFWSLGGLVHTIKADHLIREGSILKPEIVTRRTGFISSYGLVENYSKGISELTLDGQRNRLIAGDVTDYLRENAGPCLILSDRKSHCEALAELFTNQGIKTATLTGSLAAWKRKETIRAIRAGEVQAICATGSLVGEGFDLPDLTALFMATPLKFSGRVTQYVGRVLRPSPGKDRPRIFDYIDSSEPVLMASAKKRLELYSNNGWRVMS